MSGGHAHGITETCPFFKLVLKHILIQWRFCFMVFQVLYESNVSCGASPVKKKLFDRFAVPFLPPGSALPNNLTDGLFDEHDSVRLHEGSHADDVLGGNPEEVSLPVQQSLHHGVVPGDRVGDRGPAHAVRLPLLNDVVGDGRAAVVFGGIPGQLARVVGQVLTSEGEAHRSGDIWRPETDGGSCFNHSSHLQPSADPDLSQLVLPPIIIIIIVFFSPYYFCLIDENSLWMLAVGCQLMKSQREMKTSWGCK